jgi:predicted ATPase
MIEVRRKGNKLTDPFQVLLRVSGPPMNLVDVGYGVSQVLPILVDSLMAVPGQMILMQQPEVHLHPKAQAELGSFIGLLAKQDKKRFVIETHSDYLIDRVRMDIRDGKGGLSPKDVQILYFERHGPEVEIHPLEIDSGGNILGAPKGYRKFFLVEEKRFLGM